MKLKVYNLEGKEMEEMEISDSVFGVKRNDSLIHQAYVALISNARRVLAHTKTRGERAGSGIKPWKQKGTGRARVGSVRTPIWKKGGIVFGPRNDRNYTKKINKKMNSGAIAMVLGGKIQDNEVKVVDKLEMNDKKTKEFAKILKNLEMTGRILVSFSKEEKDLQMASRNIEKVSNALTDQLNVADMLDSKYILMSKSSVKFLEEKYKEK